MSAKELCLEAKRHCKIPAWILLAILISQPVLPPHMKNAFLESSTMEMKLFWYVYTKEYKTK